MSLAKGRFPELLGIVRLLFASNHELGRPWQTIFMTSRDSNWKKHLLRSSVPLEYETAKILSKNGLSVSVDYAYSRLDSGVDTECSVDIRGVGTVSLTERLSGFSSLDVLVESKYRERGTAWLFLPDPADRSARLTDVLNGVDYFSAKFIHGPAIRTTEQIDRCISGVEIRKGSSDPDEDKKDRSGSNRTRESALRHGLRQLQYALPSLIALRIRMAAFRNLEDNMPFFVVPILVTNAQLIVANAEFSVSSVELATIPDDLGKTVPCLIWSSELGPDFDLHCKRKFAELTMLTKSDDMKKVEAHRRAAGEAVRVLPSALARRIAMDGGDAMEFAKYSDVLVVNIGEFAHITERLLTLFRESCSTLKDVPVVRWTEDGHPIFPWS